MDYTVNKDVYIEEAVELLKELEQSLIILEDTPEDGEVINNIFRYLHTIKGSGAMFGFTKIADFTHEFESTFNDIRNGNCKVTKEIIDLSLTASDQIKKLLNSDSDTDIIDRKNVLSQLKKIKSNTGSKKTGTKRFLRINFTPANDVFKRGIDIIKIFEEVSSYGESKLISYIDSIPPFESYDFECCYISWLILLITELDIDEVRNAFIFVENDSEISINQVTDFFQYPDGNYKKIGEILVDNGVLTGEMISSIKSEQKLFGEIALDKGIISQEKIDGAVVEQKLARTILQEQKNKVEVSTIRIKNEKLDNLINLVGEFVTLQARLHEESVKSKQKEFLVISEYLGRITDDLRDISMNIRMIPFSETFNSFTRMIRDLSHNLNKNIQLITNGGDTEIDKNLIDSLRDPLMHIIRNAADHGLEDENTRKSKNKPVKGTITISAGYSGSNVEIIVTDDGKGLDIEKIRVKAIEKGLISHDADRCEIINTIFEPGFSTNDEATEISGRGVGMDVVKKSIEKMRGTIKINSEKDRGTSITILIPLTLAIIDGLLTSINDNHYLINLSNVEECVDLTKDILSNNHGGDVIYLRGELIPFIKIRDSFNIQTNKPDIECMVIVMVDGKKVGLVFDHVKGKHQTVIKPLSAALRSVDELSGATILGDGTIALIMDLNTIVNKNYSRLDKCL